MALDRNSTLPGTNRMGCCARKAVICALVFGISMRVLRGGVD
jgi:hypothetical protein